MLVFAADASAARRVRGASAVWDGLFARSPVGIAVFDTQLRFLQVNPALQGMNGLPEAAHVGRRLAQVLPEMNAGEMEEVMRRVLADTVSPCWTFAASEGPRPNLDRDRVWSCSFVRLEDAHGLPIGVTASIIDITAPAAGTGGGGSKPPRARSAQ